MNALIQIRRALLLIPVTALFCVNTPVYAQPKSGEWHCPADFGEFVLTVNNEGTYISKVAYNFSSWSCGSVRLSGGMSISSSPGWPITDLQFSFKNNLGISGNQSMSIGGTFKDSGEEVSGTWSANMSGTICSGEWGPVVITALEDLSGVPDQFELTANHPNPFRKHTTMNFVLESSMDVSIEIFDAAGREVATLVEARFPPGSHETTWHAGELPGGLYFARLRAGTFTAVRKLVLLK